jgi:glycosyltransferase involved in cell wall biosynthesis
MSPEPLSSLHIDTARTWRGGQNQVLLTVRGLQAHGHRAILAAHAQGELRARATGLVETVPLTVHGEVDIQAAWRLARLIARERPAVVHAHDPHGVAAAALAFAFGSAARRPALVASRRVDFHLGPGRLSRWKYRRVDLFLASSEAIRAMLVEDGIDGTRVLTVHEGVDVDGVLATPSTSVRELLGWPADALVVGNIAALVPHKGQKHLVEAARLVLERVPAARFLILGQGELQVALEHQIGELHLQGRVVLAGFRKDVLALLKTFDVFVMSSVTEGLGTSLLDAMAASRAIVATRAGGIPEVVEEGVTGLLVPPADAALLAERIVTLLKNDALRHRMGEAALARVREWFSVDRMIGATLAAYGVARGRRRGADTTPRIGRT